MNRLLHFLVPVLRGAVLAMLLAGLGDALAVALGGGADMRALAHGALFLALATGAVHEGAGTPPLHASFAWLGLGAALPLFAGFAPLTALGGLFFLLPLRALGARLAGMLAVEENPGRFVSGHALGAVLGLVWTARFGLGLSGFMLAFLGAAVLMTRAPTPATGGIGDSLTRVRRIGLRGSRCAFGAGLAWTWLLLAPLARAFDAGHAGQNAEALLVAAFFGAVGWLTFGALAAASERRWVWAAVATAALGLLLPLIVQGISDIAQPLAFDARMRVEFLRNFFAQDSPRLPEENVAYVPWVLLSTVGLPIVLGAIALRGAFGGRPTGPDDLAPTLAGVGAALVVRSLPLGTGTGEAPWLGTAAMLALLLAAGAKLAARPGAPVARAVAGGLVLIGAVWMARPFASPHLDFPVQDARPWRLARDAAGHELALAGGDAQIRVVERAGDPPEQFLARGRNVLTPELDTPGTWTREIALALACAPGAKRVLLAGAPHPASLRTLAAAGVGEAVLACDPAAAVLLRRRNPDGFGLAWSTAPAVARASGKFDLVLMRSQAMWDPRVSLLGAAAATQARSRLRPTGACVLALDPAQLAPGVLPAVLAAWTRVFGSVSLIAAPDGLRGVRLLVIGFPKASHALPAALQALALPPEQVQAAAGGISPLVAPLPRINADLTVTAWRLVDELRATRRAHAVLQEVLQGAGEAPLLLRAAALQYAVQEYSSHDAFLIVGPDAVEVSRAALQELLSWARAWPDSPWVRATWADSAATLAAKREVELIEQFVRPLREELGWREPGITLPLARAAIEELDAEEAESLLAEVLAEDPGNAEAAHWQRVLRGEDPLAPDAHAGHDHQ